LDICKHFSKFVNNEIFNTMKKYTFFSLIISFIVLFSSCKKDDTAPRIFFDGDTETSQTWVLQEYYTLPTATASDNVDGDLTTSIVITNNLTFYNEREVASDDGTYVLSDKVTAGVKGFVGKNGNYTITYSATDAAGNTGTKSISVAVKNSMVAWTETASGTRISYQTRREKIEGNLDIGGVYKIYTSHPADSYHHPTYDFNEGVTTDLRVDRNTNYKVKISRLANITGLSISFVFNRFSNEISIPTQMVTGDEYENKYATEKTEYMYIVTKNGDCAYGVFQFYITYQVARYKESTISDYAYEFEGKYWKLDRKATYKETFIKE